MSMATSSVECHVLAGGFAIVVQGLLFATCVAILIVKKLLEPTRGWRDFLLDSSKQLVGAGWIHVMNLLCAMSFEARLQTGDQCEWYWINIIADCTLGLLVEYLTLLALTHLIAKLQKKTVEDSAFASGNYRDADTNEFQLSRYVKQLALWIVVVTVMKLTMVLLMVTSQQYMQAFAHGTLQSLQSNPQAKLVVVMIATPFVMNALQFLVVDSFIRKYTRTEVDLMPVAVSLTASLPIASDKTLRSDQSRTFSLDA